MGDRVSIQFKNGSQLSVVLFSHCRGMEFVEGAKKYVAELKAEIEGKEGYPLLRLEPDTVMVDFIRQITKKMHRVLHDLYIGATEYDGDNTDNGHHVIDLEEISKEV